MNKISELKDNLAREYDGIKQDGKWYIPTELTNKFALYDDLLDCAIHNVKDYNLDEDVAVKLIEKIYDELADNIHDIVDDMYSNMDTYNGILEYTLENLELEYDIKKKEMNE